MRTRKLAAPAADAPVTMLELFFDLVFVFVVTQLTTLINASPGWIGYAHAGLVLIVVWWMYDGFAWLANNVAPTTTGTRWPMLLAMGCFLALAIVVPDAFDHGRWIFFGGYLLIVTIHAVQFSRSSLGESSRAIVGVLPVNYGVALMLLVAAILGPHHAWIGWVAAVVVLLVAALARPAGGFTLREDHFAERHHLLIIIALGETIVATGVGAESHLTHLDVFAAVGLALLLVSSYWWLYFGSGDDERGVAAIRRTPDRFRTSRAFVAYSILHLVHVAGLVLVAVGLHDVVHAPGHHLGLGTALAFGGGSAIFLLAQASFRIQLAIGSPWILLIGAVLAAVTSALGPLSGLAQLIGLAVVVVVTAVAEQLTDPGPDADVESRRTVEA